jgi:hypothetical protein
MAFTTGNGLVVADADGANQRTIVTRQRPVGLRTMSFSSWPPTSPAWSPDGRLIALPEFELQGPEQAARERALVVDVASGAVQVIPIASEGAVGFAWLNAETLVMNQAGQLWRFTYPDGRTSRLTNDLLSYRQISLTADRTSLATTRSEQRASIWIMDGAANSGQEAVPLDAELTGPLTWSADRLLYASANAVMSLSGDRTTQVVAAASPAVASSADGRVTVYSNAADGADRRGLWRVRHDATTPVRLLAEAVTPRLSPDGRFVVFLSRREGAQSPWLVPIDGGDPVKLDEAFVPYLALDISPDSRFLAFAQGSTQVLTICELPACKTRRQIEIPPRGRGPIRWRPDGQAIAMKDATLMNIVVQPLDGRPAYPLTHFTDRDILDFAWSADGTRLAMSRAFTTNDIVLFKGLR